MNHINNIFFFKIIFIFIIIVFQTNKLFSQNVAQGKGYTFSVQPNYPKSAKNNVNGLLTNGIFQTNIVPTFWTNGKSLGWMGQNKIEINIDLKSIHFFSTISLNTANGEDVGVYFPQNIFVFSSNDNSTFSYLGDLVSLNDNNESETKSIKNFTLSSINNKARYIKFVILPKNNYFFVDEIQVIKGKASSIKKYQSVSLNKLQDFIEDKIQEKKEARSSRLSTNSNKTSNFSNSTKGIGLESVNFGIFKSGDSPNRNSNLLSVSNIGFANEFITNVVRISNNSSKQMQLKLNIGTNKNVKIYQGSEVTNSTTIDLIDGLINLSNSTLSLQPYSTKLIVIKAKFNSIGNFDEAISFVNINGSGLESKISIKYSVFKKGKELNANNWAYFNYPQIQNVKTQAINDLSSHGINTFPIPRDILIKAVNDKPGFRKYLSGVPTSSNLLLFFNFGKADAKMIGGNKYPFLSDLWKKSFQKTLNTINMELSSLGYSKIYLYPYDEIEKKDLGEFKELNNWLRKTLHFKTFVTLLSMDAVDAGNYVDIIQVNRKIITNPNIWELPSEKWIYEIGNYARDRNPSSYRKMAWEAYYYKAKGIGFWNYSQTTLPINKLNSRYSNGRSDYSVIYNDSNGNILSSMRWEAFYQGIQDYYLLMLMEKIKGYNWTQKFVKEVIDDKSHSYEILNQNSVILKNTLNK